MRSNYRGFFTALVGVLPLFSKMGIFCPTCKLDYAHLGQAKGEHASACYANGAGAYVKLQPSSAYGRTRGTFHAESEVEERREVNLGAAVAYAPSSGLVPLPSLEELEEQEASLERAELRARGELG